MRFSGAAGGLVKSCERKRSAQFEAAGLLLLRHGDGGEEGVFGGDWVGGVFLEQDFAALAVNLDVEPAVSCASEILKRLIERGQSGFCLPIPRFRLRKSRPDERLKSADAILL